MAESWGFWEWLSFLTVLVILTAWMLVLVDRVERWLDIHHPRRCSLCHEGVRRPGDVLCIYCTQLLRKPPEPLYLDREVRRG